MPFVIRFKHNSLRGAATLSKALYLGSPQIRLLSILFLLIGTGAQARAATAVTEPSTGITLSVNSSGAYSVTTQDPAWTFGGNVGHTVAVMGASTGADGIGSYQQIVFTYADGASRQGTLRTYQGKPIVIFDI